MHTTWNSPLGPILLCANDEGLTAVSFYPDGYPEGDPEGTTPDIQAAQSALKEYFEGKDADFSGIKLAPHGTEFQHAVWAELLAIPYGTTCSYGDIAKRLQSQGRKASPRSVGGAVGRNPICIIIPCHRVIGADGSMTGYGGGMQNKVALLKIEGVLADSQLKLFKEDAR